MRKDNQPHKHTFHKAYKKTRNINGPRYLWLWVCKCGYKEAFDLKDEPPV